MTGEVLKPLGGHPAFLLLVQIALLLVVTRIGAELVKRLGQPAVVGELAAGIALGPSLFGHFAPGLFDAVFPHETTQFQLLEVVGLLGMVLLLLLTGLETDLKLLRHLGRAAFIASVMGMVVPFVSGLALGALMPGEYLANPDHRVLFSLFLATAMAISAMPVIAKILMDLGLTRRNIGLVILSAGVVDDTAGWLILSLIAGVATQGSLQLGGLLMTVIFTGVFLAGVALVLYPATRWLMGVVTRKFATPDADLVLLFVVTLFCAAATEAIGIHAVFGAFIAGTMFRQIPTLKHDTEKRLESFVMAVLAPIFFGIVGLKVNLWSLSGGGMLAVVLTVACLGKLVGCTLGGLWGGLRFWESFSIAVAMNARGAMGLVVATIGLSLGLLNEQIFSIIVMVAVVTSFMAPLGLRLTMKRVRLTAEESQRILAEESKGAFDRERVRVLFPASGGTNLVAAARLAAGMSQGSAHPMEVLHVHARRRLGERLAALLPWRKKAPEPGADAQNIEQQLKDAGVLAPLKRVTQDAVSDAVLQQAQKGCDLIVVGASRRGDALGGPVLEEIVRGAPCHVAIVKAGPNGNAYKKMLVLFDGTTFARVAVDFAVRCAETLESELTIAVVPQEKSLPDEEVTEPGADSRLQPEAISTVFRASKVKPRVVRWDQSVNDGHDLVVLGAENRAIQNRLFFGTDNERLIAEESHAVAIVVPNVAQLS
jgi:Kef-type K+ transport system membrane component KefB/nucleotide-binding universal stress UspA family protein